MDALAAYIITTSTKSKVHSLSLSIKTEKENNNNVVLRKSKDPVEFTRRRTRIRISN